MFPHRYLKPLCMTSFFIYYYIKVNLNFWVSFLLIEPLVSTVEGQGDMPLPLSAFESGGGPPPSFFWNL